ncbi:unnamed protein product [Schistosoma curassoni]|uniref:Uncharacterized protein n=1 Tax=Schistosoma curassoni TaxID=6186 RepID=A0A183JJL5_9TREM|nr:unnamed protein product [Schistosoma curassoni]
MTIYYFSQINYAFQSMDALVVQHNSIVLKDPFVHKPQMLKMGLEYQQSIYFVQIFDGVWDKDHLKDSE